MEHSGENKGVRKGHLGEPIAEITNRISVEGKTAWEEKLKLYVRPKPDWMLDEVWRKICNLVLVQTVERSGQ